MSQLLQVQYRGGNFNASTSAITHYSGGLPFTAAGLLAVDYNGIVDHYHQGLPFNAAGALVCTTGTTQYYSSGAAPFSAEKLNVASGAPVAHVGGVPFIANELVRMSVVG